MYVTLFNCKELFVTYSLKEQARVRDVLSAEGIGYDIKPLNLARPSPMTAGRKAVQGNFGIDQSISCEYKIHVKKEDFERA